MLCRRFVLSSVLQSQVREAMMEAFQQPTPPVEGCWPFWVMAMAVQGMGCFEGFMEDLTVVRVFEDVIAEVAHPA